MPDQRATPDRVNAFWDALVLGHEDTGADIEPDVAMAIRHFQSLGSTLPVTARERVWQRVQAAAVMQQEGDEVMQPSVVPGGSPSLVAIPRPNPRARPWRDHTRWMLAQIATAALLVLTLVASFLLLGPPRFNRGSEVPAFVPAINATPATPEPTASPAARFLWQSDGGPDFPYGEPSHLAVDPDGKLWVTDGANSRFLIYAPDGTLLETWGVAGTGNGEFDFLTDGGTGLGAVAFDSAGNIYVADTDNQRVQKFDPDRTFIRSWGRGGTDDGQFLTPLALTVDDRGRVFVSDHSASTVQVFDGNNGQWLATWATYGTDPGEVASPGGLAIDSEGNLWVVEGGNYRVQKFSPDGESLLTWGQQGFADGELSSPTAVAIDDQGRVYVADRAANRVQVFTPDGIFLGGWGESGNKDGQFRGSYGLALDGRGIAYVTEDVGLRVQAFQLLPPFGPGQAQAAGSEPGTTGPVAEFLWQSDGGPDLPLGDPTNLAIDPNGNIWVTDGRNSRFQIFAPDGTFLETWGTPGGAEGQLDFVEPTLFGGFGAGSMAFDADGNLYIADPGNYRIQKFGPDRSFITSWGSNGLGDGQFLAILDLAVDAQGRVYVTDESRGDVQRFDADGTFMSVWSKSAEEWLGKPSAIEIDAGGNLWFTHFQKHAVQKYSPDGKLLASWGELGFAEGQLNNPSGLAIDNQGRVFVSEWANNRIQVFDSDGTFITLWGTIGLDGGQFRGPNDSVLDGLGNIYVAEDGIDRIQKFRLLPPLVPG